MGSWRSGRVVPLYGWRVCFLSKTIRRISRTPSSISATFLSNTFGKRDKREDGAANGLDGKGVSVAEVVNVNRRCRCRRRRRQRVEQSTKYEWRENMFEKTRQKN